MKKLLLSLLCVLTFGCVVQAAEQSYTITFMTNTSDNSTALTTSSATSAYVESGSEYIGSIKEVSKVYPKSINGMKFSSSSANGNITWTMSDAGKVAVSRVVVTACKYKTDAGQLAVNNSAAIAVDTDLKDYTFSITDTKLAELTLHATKRIYVKSVTVYYEAAEDKVATPTFSVPAGEFSEAFDLNLSCATDGATIYYSTDGSEPTTEYTAAISVPAATTTVKAVAKLSGKTDSDVAEATYTYLDPAQFNCADIAEWLTKAKADSSHAYTITGNVTVTASENDATDGAKQRYVWLADDAGNAIMVYGSDLTQTQGQKYEGLSGIYDEYRGNVQMKNSNLGSLTSTGNAWYVEPATMAVADVTDADANKYVVFNNVTVNTADGTIAEGDDTLKFFDKFNNGLLASDGVYKVTGVLAKFNNDMQIYPLAAVQSITFDATDKNGVAVEFQGTVAEDAAPVTVVITNPNGGEWFFSVSNNSTGESKDYEPAESTYTLVIDKSGEFVISAGVGSDFFEFAFTIEGEVEFPLTAPMVEFLDDEWNEVESPAMKMPVNMTISHQNWMAGEGVTLVYTINGVETETTEYSVEIPLTEAGVIEYSAYVYKGTKSKSPVTEGTFEIDASALKLAAPEITFTTPEGEIQPVTVTITNTNYKGAGTLIYNIGTGAWSESEEDIVTFTLPSDGVYTVRAYVRNDADETLNSDITEKEYTFSGIEGVAFGNEGVSVEGSRILAPEGAVVYGINGVKVNGDRVAPGIYIVRLSNGSAAKVIVK